MDTAAASLSILIVEDNDNLRDSIVDELTTRGHHVRGIDCAEALPEQPHLAHLDLAILDLNLPGEDGLSLANRLRSSHPELGIIMLTARIQTEERASGYAHGADIYLIKPASLSELNAAINALARRLKPDLTAVSNSLRVYPSQRKLTTPDGSIFSLTEHESSLLVAFSRAPQNTLCTWQIAEILGMDMDQPNKPAIELHIVRLRKKLPLLGSSTSPIQAIRGYGYRLCVETQIA